MPDAERYRTIRRRRKAAHILSRVAHSKPLTDEEKRQVAAAARTMLLAANRKIGKSGRVKRARAAGQAYWAAMTVTERQIEAKRRARVREKNRLARAKKKLGLS